jgi:hypothetical protein
VEEQPFVEGKEEEQPPSEDEQVRQRVGMSRPMRSSEMQLQPQPQPQPQPQHATIGIVSSTSDSYKNWLMWLLVAAIIFLIYRRLFLM